MVLELEEKLIEYGLTRNEARVYLALLKLGSATAVDITKVSKVHRVNVYDVLERLRSKGLISNIIRANKNIYEPSDPDQLNELIKEKETLITEIMPRLKQEFSMKKDKKHVYNFFGPDGVMRAYYMMLDQNETVYALGGSGQNRQYLKHRHEMWTKERREKQIAVKALYFEHTRKNKKKLAWSDPTVDIRYLPDRFKTIGMIDICGNLIVNLLPVEDDFMAIVIQNRALADSYRTLFEFIWQYAEE